MFRSESTVFHLFLLFEHMCIIIRMRPVLLLILASTWTTSECEENTMCEKEYYVFRKPEKVTTYYCYVEIRKNENLPENYNTPTGIHPNTTITDELCLSLFKIRRVLDFQMDATNSYNISSTGKIIKVHIYPYLPAGLPQDKVRNISTLCDANEIYKDCFKVCSSKSENNYIYSQKNKLVLKLEEPMTELCGKKAWKTDLQDILVFTSDIEQTGVIKLTPDALKLSVRNATYILANTSCAKDFAPIKRIMTTAVSSRNPFAALKDNASQSSIQAPIPDEESDDNMEWYPYFFLISIIGLFIFCNIFCCIFNISVNFFTLKASARKNKSKDKMYYMNCFSESLTNRYLYMSHRRDTELNKVPKETNGVETNAQHTYMTIENDNLPM